MIIECQKLRSQTNIKQWIVFWWTLRKATEQENLEKEFSIHKM